jgi:predicted nucleotidyltransferase
MNTTSLKDYFKKEIRLAVTQLRTLNPEKIILYGSASWGKLRQESDLDFLIVRNTNKPFLQRNIDAAKCLDLNVPYDVFVVTPKEFQDRIVEQDSFISKIIKSGTVLYAR